MYARDMRYKRLLRARKLGTHTKEEWQSLYGEFGGRCVRCGKVASIFKDHIVALCLGGSDSISNIQPICFYCNASKGPETFDWKEFRRKFGFDVSNPIPITKEEKKAADAKMRRLVLKIPKVYPKSFFKRCGRHGGKASAKLLTDIQRKEKASNAANVRWEEYRKRKAAELLKQQ